MAGATNQKRERRASRRGPGPLLSLLVLFGDAEAAAELFRMVWWADGVRCPKGHTDIAKFCRYGEFQRYTCKICNKTFNDKTGTILHYRHIGLGDWMLAVWMYFCGPLNGISINHIAKSVGQAYGTVYYMIRGMMDKVRSLQERTLSGTCETDELYVRAGSKGVALETNGEDRTLPSRRGLPRGPGRGTFQKNTPMVTIYHQRAAENSQDWTIFDVPRDGRTLLRMVGERIEAGSTVMTDEHSGYKNLKKSGYDHHAIHHSEGEYASGEHNEIHTNNCECRVGLLKWWLKKHRGVSKWHLISYVKSFQFTHNHRHHSIEGRFLVTLVTLLDTYHDPQAVPADAVLAAAHACAA